MGELRYIPDSLVAERHRKARNGGGSVRPEMAKLPETRNVDTVLSLGRDRYFRFHGRLYGTPSLSYRMGHRILDAYTRAVALAEQMSRGGDRETKEQYYRCMAVLGRLMWRQSFPAHKALRLMRRVGLLRNPFTSGTERELLELAGFFLRGRMLSSVQLSLTSPAKIDQ